MLGLPKLSELIKQLPKAAIYKKFNMNTAAKEKFDADIKKIVIVNEISSKTLNIEKGKEISCFYVLHVKLKRKDFDNKTIEQISKLIDQKMILLLEFEEISKIIIYHTKLIQSEWKNNEDIKVELKGLNLDSMWKNIIIEIGGIDLQEGKSLEEQILFDDRKIKLKKKETDLEKRARAEKQPKKKFELFQQIKKIKAELEEI